MTETLKEHWKRRKAEERRREDRSPRDSETPSIIHTTIYDPPTVTYDPPSSPDPFDPGGGSSGGGAIVGAGDG
jgi:hypothetical protein